MLGSQVLGTFKLTAVGPWIACLLAVTMLSIQAVWRVMPPASLGMHDQAFQGVRAPRIMPPENGSFAVERDLLLSSPDASASTARRPAGGRTAVVTFQQNEIELLSDWIQYHARIFGHHRIYIIDHNSTAPHVVHMLALVQTLGVTVIPFKRDFEFKKHVMSKTIKKIFDENADVDTAIPLDIDEFIVARDPDASNDQTFTTSKRVIQAHIDALPRDGYKYKFGNINAAACRVAEVALGEAQSHRALSALYFANVTQQLHDKTFFGRDGYIRTDQGNHAGRVEKDSTCSELGVPVAAVAERVKGVNTIDGPGTLAFSRDGKDCFHRTPLALVHYGTHALSFTAWRNKMLRGYYAYGYDDGRPCEGTGHHYCLSVKMIRADPKGMQAEMEQIHCAEDLYYSTFMASALMGRPGTLDFTSAPKLDLASLEPES